MEMQSERHLPLPRQTVWDALNDPAVLRACVPGCESLEEIETDRYEAVVMAKVGPVKARFRSHISVLDADPPAGYRLSFEGQGGAAGFARGSADVALADEGGEACTLSYTATASVGGKLAQVGSRLVQGAARKMADQFFDNLVAELGDGGEETAPEQDADGGDDESGGGWKFWKKK